MGRHSDPKNYCPIEFEDHDMPDTYGDYRDIEMAAKQDAMKAAVAPPSLEQDLDELDNIDGQIRSILERRSTLINQIEEKHHVARSRLAASMKFFDGDVRGQPVSDMDGTAEYRRY